MTTRYIIWLIAIASSFGLFAKQPLRCPAPSQPSQPQPHEPLVSVTADFLYWQASQGGMSYGSVFNYFADIPAPPLSATQNFVGSYLDIDFQFDPGVRTSVGFWPQHDLWKIDFIWTHLNTKASGISDNPNAVGGPVVVPNGFFSVPQPQANNGINAKATWWANYNTIDLDISRKLLFSNSFNLKAHFGLRNLWLNEKYYILSINTWDSLTPPILFLDCKSKLTQNIWGLGPLVGFDSLWEAYRGFGLFGNATFALLWSHVHSTNMGYILGTKPTLTVKQLATFHTTVPEIGLIVGGQYDFNVFNKCHGSVRIGWEFQTLLDVNFLDADFSSSGNFNMSGLTTGFDFDF